MEKEKQNALEMGKEKAQAHEAKAKAKSGGVVKMGRGIGMKKRIHIPKSLIEFISSQKPIEKDPKAWDRWLKLRFHGGKSPDCLDI